MPTTRRGTTWEMQVNPGSRKTHLAYNESRKVEGGMTSLQEEEEKKDEVGGV